MSDIENEEQVSRPKTVRRSRKKSDTATAAATEATATVDTAESTSAEKKAAPAKRRSRATKSTVTSTYGGEQSLLLQGDDDESAAENTVAAGESATAAATADIADTADTAATAASADNTASTVASPWSQGGSFAPSSAESDSERDATGDHDYAEDDADADVERDYDDDYDRDYDSDERDYDADARDYDDDDRDYDRDERDYDAAERDYDDNDHVYDDEHDYGDDADDEDEDDRYNRAYDEDESDAYYDDEDEDNRGNRLEDYEQPAGAYGNTELPVAAAAGDGAGVAAPEDAGVASATGASSAYSSYTPHIVDPDEGEAGAEVEVDTPEDALTATAGAAPDDAAESSESSEAQEDTTSFADLNLSAPVLKAIQHEGFEQPTPIQMRSIPTILSGRDMIGQAQTGTGKTAAFALPILSQMPKGQRSLFALVLEPTRELALQVSESFSRFAHFMDNFKVVPIYGGASYESQIRSLRHGAQVVVATPGRLIDLIDKGRLDFSDVKYVVIDEADEMLRMGFIDDVDWILDKLPEQHQTALFSATMPPVIRRIAKQHLIDPLEVRIQSHTTTATTVRQRYWVVSGLHKIDAMTRMLEVEPYDAVLVFVRTKTDAEDVANKLAGRGFACAALHGDIPQRQREKIVERLKNGSLDIIVATDVAARGLDVDRITHVFNYDIPYDAESYVHRIGRTGRAGRTGEAILFVSPRERRALRQIERVTRQRIEPMRMPTIEDVNKRRLENFRNQVIETIDAGGLGEYLEVVSDILSDDSIEPELLAAALAKMAQRDGSLLLDVKEEPKFREFSDRRERSRDRDHDRNHERDFGDRERRHRHGPSPEAVPLRAFPELKMVRYRLSVGHRDGVKPGQIVGAIANEANIDSKYIGEISIFDTFSTVDLPVGMPEETMAILARARVRGRALELREYTLEPPPRRERRERDRDFDRERRERRFHGERRDRRERRDYEPRSERDYDSRPERDYDSRAERSQDNEDDMFSYMDEGEYRHEKGDVNGNSIDYHPRKKSPDQYSVGIGFGYDKVDFDQGVVSGGRSRERDYDNDRDYDYDSRPPKGSKRRSRPNFDFDRRSSRSSSRYERRGKPRFH